jgi:hypothetical protein
MTMVLKASFAVQNAAMALFQAVFGLKSTSIAANDPRLLTDTLHSNDAVIGGFGSTVATAMMLLA